MGEHHRVERVKRIDLGHVKIRRPVRGTAGLLAAIHQDLALRRRYQKRGPADLAAAPERRDPQPLVLARDLAVDAMTDLAQERLALVLHRPEERADLLHRRALDGRCPDNLRCPADLFCDLAKRDAVLADDHAGLLCLDQDLARLRVKEEIGYPGVLRHNGADLLGRPFRIFEDVRAHDDALAQIARKDLDQVRLVGKLFWVISVDDELRPFELDV